MLERTVWKISLPSVVSNLKKVSRFAGRRVVAVVKADAYGHGAVPIARALEPQEELLAFAVAHPEEGVFLRKAGIKKPIWVLFGFFPEEVSLLKVYRLIPIVGNLTQLKLVVSLKIPYQINIDTGMGRCGFLVPPYGILKTFLPEGAMTHFSSAELDRSFTENQIRRFFNLLRPLKGLKHIHLQNSAGLLYKIPEATAVRVGITLYGEYPSKGLEGKLPPLDFPSEIYSRLLAVRRLPKGSCISYGCRYRLKRDSYIGIVPFGYADGLRRKLSNRLKVLYEGREFPIVGNITMDLAAVDFGDFKPPEGGKVVFVNSQRRFSDWASLLQTVPYEVMTSFGRRVKRTYGS